MAGASGSQGRRMGPGQGQVAAARGTADGGGDHGMPRRPWGEGRRPWGGDRQLWEGRAGNRRWAAMEVLEVEDDSDMWVPHVSGSSQVKGAVGRGTMRISHESACVAASVACAGMPHRQKLQT
jgi:hypothetical protein